MLPSPNRESAMNRRELLAVVPAFAAVASAGNWAEAGAVSREAASLYDRALVFDANAIPRIQDKFPFPRKLLEIMRQSGVTAMKTTLGGIDGTFEDTFEDI